MSSDIAKLRQNLHSKSFNYDIRSYPFKEILEELLGCSLDHLHETLGDFEKFRRNNDQSTLAHKVFYSNFRNLIRPTYEKFIKEVVSKIIYPYKFYYQLIPTFRVGLPGNVFVGEYHKDSQYNHLPYEINFNLGLANYVGEAAFKTQKIPLSASCFQYFIGINIEFIKY